MKRMMRTAKSGFGMLVLALAGGLVAQSVRAQSDDAVGMSAQGPERALILEQRGAESLLRLPAGALVRRTTAQVQNARLVEIEHSPTQVATWDEAADGIIRSYFAVSMDGVKVDTVESTAYELKLRHARFNPLEAVDAVAAELETPADNTMHIVQFVTMPLEVYRQQIAALGGIVRQYMPDHAAIVELPTPEARAQVAALPYVRSVQAYPVAYRVEEVLRDVLAGRVADSGAKRYRIRVFDKRDAQKYAVADRIREMGGTIDVLNSGGFLFEARLTRDQLAAVARMNEVEFIDLWSPPQSFMNNVRIVGGANTLESLGGYTGAGVRAEVMDDGCQTTHPDFTGRILIRGNTGFAAASHGTATFGIVFGSGAGSATARGMMPSAIGYFNDWNFPTNRYTDLAQLITPPYNCVFQSNSWSFGYTLNYTNVSAEMDDAVFDHDLVVLNSQGNSGSQQGTEHGWAKNVVGVGGVVHNNNSNVADDFWGGTGSIGPAADGRIKPDLCFWYESIRTTTPTSTYTNSFGGTSAACPETAGHFGLFFEMWADGAFGNQVSGGTVFDERAHSSTARAIMINTASQYPFSGTGHDLTRTHQGWGRPDVARLYNLRNNIFIIDEDKVLLPFQTATYSTQIVPGQPNHNELRVTLTYNDPPGTTSAGQHRINNMTLKVTSPTGTIYYGNNGLLAGNWSTAGGSPNTIDTVENVFVQNPTAGSWLIEVTAAEVNQDGHVETPQIDMDYALVISGGVTGNDCNGNEIPDSCDLDCGLLDCNVPGCGLSLDCNANGVPDECELPDCNANEVPDSCELADNDCNSDFVPDDCQLAANDCDANLIPDDCDEVTLAATINAPADQAPCNGGQAVFGAAAPGATGYQWFRNGSETLSDGGNIAGANSATLTVDPASVGDEGTYHCVVSFGCIDANSESATLDLATDDLQVTLISPSPIQTCASAGATIAAFEVSVNDPTAVSYQWSLNGNDLFDGGNISGANSPRVEINPATGADVGFYTCTVSNACDLDTPTAVGELRIASSFAEQPAPTVCVEYGSNAVFTAEAGTNPAPDFYRWYEGLTQLTDGGRISGAWTDTMTLTNVQLADHGRTFQLRLIVGSPFCSNYSQTSQLMALPVGGCPDCPNPGDMDGDGDFDLADAQLFAQCFDADVLTRSECGCANVHPTDTFVNLLDWEALEALLTGPN